MKYIRMASLYITICNFLSTRSGSVDKVQLKIRVKVELEAASVEAETTKNTLFST